MKKFLSILLAVMMVLSTVSFAAPLQVQLIQLLKFLQLKFLQKNLQQNSPL